MKRVLPFLSILLLAYFPQLLFAGEPVITNDVHVIQNAKPGDCKATWSGTGPPVAIQADTGQGMMTTMAPGYLSCTGCAFDQASGDCVCKSCEETYN